MANEALKVGREKYWGEKSDQEKIESLARCLRSLADSHYRLLCKMERMERHTHDTQGQAVTPINSREEYGVYHQWARELAEEK